MAGQTVHTLAKSRHTSMAIQRDFIDCAAR
jgi:hypothetical protein